MKPSLAAPGRSRAARLRSSRSTSRASSRISRCSARRWRDAPPCSAPPRRSTARPADPRRPSRTTTPRRWPTGSSTPCTCRAWCKRTGSDRTSFSSRSSHTPPPPPTDRRSDPRAPRNRSRASWRRATGRKTRGTSCCCASCGPRCPAPSAALTGARDQSFTVLKPPPTSSRKSRSGERLSPRRRRNSTTSSPRTSRYRSDRRPGTPCGSPGSSSRRRCGEPCARRAHSRRGPCRTSWRASLRIRNPRLWTTRSPR
mmetsp:Transcript_82/g.379  ORF Transcript_82/g.379 Transcript_82/m.379 type:complete len:256 (-) Transcript_82:399-1166(-)